MRWIPVAWYMAHHRIAARAAPASPPGDASNCEPLAIPAAGAGARAAGAGARGPITEQIQKAFFGLFDGRTTDEWGWLDYVDMQAKPRIAAAG